jgi:hypothetical protein
LITPEQISVLAKRNINGRQIKNAARTAQSLAVGKGEHVTFEHLNRTLDVMEDFQAEFRRGAKGLSKEGFIENFEGGGLGLIMKEFF